MTVAVEWYDGRAESYEEVETLEFRDGMMRMGQTRGGVTTRTYIPLVSVRKFTTA